MLLTDLKNKLTILETVREDIFATLGFNDNEIFDLCLAAESEQVSMLGKKYKQLQREYHPDRCIQLEGETTQEFDNKKEACTTIAKIINESYDKLKVRDQDQLVNQLSIKLINHYLYSCIERRRSRIGIAEVEKAKLALTEKLNKGLTPGYPDSANGTAWSGHNPCYQAPNFNFAPNSSANFATSSQSTFNQSDNHFSGEQNFSRHLHPTQSSSNQTFHPRPEPSDEPSKKKARGTKTRLESQILHLRNYLMLSLLSSTEFNRIPKEVMHALFRTANNGLTLILGNACKKQIITENNSQIMLLPYINEATLLAKISSKSRTKQLQQSGNLMAAIRNQQDNDLLSMVVEKIRNRHPNFLDKILDYAKTQTLNTFSASLTKENNAFITQVIMYSIFSLANRLDKLPQEYRSVIPSQSSATAPSTSSPTSPRVYGRPEGPTLFARTTPPPQASPVPEENKEFDFNTDIVEEFFNDFSPPTSPLF